MSSKLNVINSDGTSLSINAGNSQNVLIGSGTNKLGLNVTPQSAFHLTGERLSTSTVEGIHMGLTDTTNYGIEISSSTGTGIIDFSEPNVNYNGRIRYDGTSDFFDFYVSGSGTSSLNISSSIITTPNTVSITNTTESTSITTGSINTLGGLGVTKDTFIGGDLYVGQTGINGGRVLLLENDNNGSSAFSILRLINDTVDGLAVFLNSSTRTTDGGVNNATIRNDIGELNLQGADEVGLNISSSGVVSIANTTASTSTTTAALKLAGGISTTNTTDSTSLTNGGTITTPGGAAIGKKLYVGTGLNLNSLTPSQAVYTDASKNLVSVDLTSNLLISVKDFGAVGDGVTDDTAALQAAINAAAPYVWQGSINATNNAQQAVSSLFVPRGVYRITAPLLLAKSLHMFGEIAPGFGQGSDQAWIIADFDDMNGYIFDCAPYIADGTRPLGASYTGAQVDAGTVSSTSCIILEYLLISPSAGRKILGGMNLTTAVMSHVRHCGIINTNVGIRLTAAFSGSFKDNHIFAKAQGIYCNNAVTVWDIENNYITVNNTPDTGYVFPDGGVTDNFLAGTVIKNNYSCILLKFAGPVIKNNTIELGNIGIAVESCGGLNIIANYMEGIKQHCYAVNTTDVNIKGGYTFCELAKLLWVNGSANQTTFMDYRGVSPITTLSNAFDINFVDRVVFKTSQSIGLLYNEKVDFISPEHEKGTNTIWLSSSGNDLNSASTVGTAVLTLQEALRRIRPGMYNQIIIPAGETVSTKSTVGAIAAASYIIPSTSLSISSLGTGLTRGTINVNATGGLIDTLQMEGGNLQLTNLVFNIAAASDADFRPFIRTLGNLNVGALSCDFIGVGSTSAVFGGRTALSTNLYINTILCNFNNIHFIKESSTGTVLWSENNSGSSFTSVTTDTSYRILSKQFPQTITGTGIPVYQTSPTLITPILGVASGTSLDLTGTTASTSSTTGVLTIDGGLGISNTTDATSSTNGGAATIAGGLAVAQSAFVGGLLTGNNGLSITSGASSLGGNLSFLTDAFIGRNTSDASDSGSITISGGGADGFTRGGRIILSGNERVTFGGKVEIAAGDTSSIDFYTNNTLRSSINGSGVLSISTSTASTSSSTGALVLSSGGLAIGNATDAASATNGGGATIAGGLGVGQNAYFGKSVVIGQNGAYTPGCLYSDANWGMIIRGAQVSPNLADFNFIDASGTALVYFTAPGNIQAFGTTASTSSTTGSIRTAGGFASSNTTDAVSYLNGGSMSLAGGAAIAKKVFIGGDTAVGAGNPVDGERLLRIGNLSNTANSFSRLLLSNDTAAGLSIFVNSSSRTADGGVGTATLRNDVGSLRLQSLGSVGLTIAATTGVVTGSSTVASTSSTTGGLVLSGGLGISNTTDAVSVTNGGAMTIGGGLAVAKKLIVGGNANFATGISTDDTVNVKHYGAMGDGTTDDTTAITNAIAAISSGTVYFPPGDYLISSLITISNKNSLILKGCVASGPSTGNGARIRINTDISCFTFSNCQRSGIENLGFFSAAVRTAGVGITLTADSFQCIISKVRFDSMYECINVNSSTESRVSDVMIRGAHGLYPIKYSGTVSLPSYRAIFKNITCDMPLIYPETNRAYLYANNLPVVTGDYIYTTTLIYQVKTSGTTAASGTPTSRTTNLTNGTAVLDYVGGAVSWFLMESYAFSCIIESSNFIHGVRGVQMKDSAGTTAGGPDWMQSFDLECDHNLIECVLLEGGSGFYTTTSWFGSAMNGNGIYATNTFDGEIGITNSRIFGVGEHGVLIDNNASKPNAVMITGNTISAVSQKSAGTYHGVSLGSNFSGGVVITGNIIGEDYRNASPTPTQGYGVLINTGGSDYIIDNNYITNFVFDDVSYGTTNGYPVKKAGRLKLIDFTDSSSITTGALVTEGGAGIGKSLYVGGNATVGTGNPIAGTRSLTVQNTDAGSTSLSLLSLANNTGNLAVFFLNSSTRSSDGGVNTATLRNDAGSLRLQSAGATGLTITGTTGVVTGSSTVASTSSTTGGLVLSGGLGISNTTDAVSSTNGGSGTLAGGLAVAKNLYVGQTINSLGSMVDGGFDFVLGNTDQTTRGNSGSSRALVKDVGNILKINFEGDFTGGTFVDSNLRVDGHITTLSLPMTFSSTWEVYGDSISAGVGVNSNQIWHYLVKNTLGNTVVNNAVSGYFTHDNTTRIYNQRTFGASRTTAIFIGTNDIRKQITSYTGELDRVFDNCMSCLEAGIVFCALQSANIFNARGATETGTWVNTAVYTNLGRGTNTNGSTSARTVTGRFVAFTVTTTNPANSSTYYGEPFDVSITNFVTDGDNTNGTFSMTNVYAAHEMVTGVVANWSNRCFIFDTGVVGGSHTITITHSANTGTDAFYIDWYAGWDTTSTFNNVLVLGVPPWNYRIDYRGDAGALYQNDTRRSSFEKRKMDICHTLRTSFGLPVYYVDIAAPDAGGLTADGLHPNFSGQKYIANRVLSVVNNGEYNYI